MRALITGIDGFVGRYLSTELSTHGYEVFGTTIGPDKENVRHIELTDPDSVLKVLDDIRPDVIFHLAGFTSVKESWDKPEEAMRINRDGTRNLYQALKTLRLSPRVLITSTAEVYGIPRSLPISETHPTAPNNPYAVSKLAQEEVAREFLDIPTIIARSFPHIGPGQSPTFVTSDFAQQIVKVERGLAEAVHVGNLVAERDFTDVRDVVVAYRLLMELGQPQQIYNVCSGKSYSIKEILNRLTAQSSTSDIAIINDPQKMRPSDIPILLGDNAKASVTTKWSPNIPLKETLSNIIRFYREVGTPTK